VSDRKASYSEGQLLRFVVGAVPGSKVSPLQDWEAPGSEKDFSSVRIGETSPVAIGASKEVRLSTGLGRRWCKAQRVRLRG
jgi:hypothetical protein